MAKFKIDFTKKARKQIEKLPLVICDPIYERIILLAENPRPMGSEKLASKPGYRIRVGDYRVVYHIYDSSLLILIYFLVTIKDIYL